MRAPWSWACLSSLLVLQLVSAQDPWPPSPHVASTPPLTPAEQRKKFQLPPGFDIELVAAEPQINKPINIAFDAQGRLWVTGSVEYPHAAKEGKGRDKVWILGDFAADGKARKVTVFAEGLNIPIGVLPLPDCQSALVYSIPNIYKLTDTDGDGKADKKEVLYTGYGFGDTHGMTGEFTWGLDGWIYCCHGFSNTSKVKSKGATQITMQSGNTYRIKPDGGKIEQWTWGQVNPFGLTFDPLGNLYSTDCHTRPLYQLLRGAYYPSFGKPHDGLGFGPEMVTHDHGSTAIAGIVYYAADQFPKEFHDNLFVGNVVTNRINRDRIEWKGSTPKGIEMPDLVKCDDPWFRPVDIKLGPDGCLYVADFYNRIIGHYEVPLDHPGRDREKGRIWRIVYRGQDGKGGPRPVIDLTKASVAELINALNSPNLEVRTQATNRIVDGKESNETVRLLKEIVEIGKPTQQIHALWALDRLNRLHEQMLLSQLKSPDRDVKVQALKLLAERPQWSQAVKDLAMRGLENGDPFVQRAAAEALGTRADVLHLYALAHARQKVSAQDTHLLHAVRLALRNQWRDAKLAKTIPNLSFPAGDGLEALADVCLAVPSPESARFLYQFGMRANIPLPLLLDRMQHVFRHGQAEIRRSLLIRLEADPRNDVDYRTAAVKALALGTRERGGQLNDDERRWAEKTIVGLLDGPQDPKVHGAVELAGQLKIVGAQTALLDLAKNGPTIPVRRSAVVALVHIEPRKHLETLSRLLLDESDALEVREQVAASLAGANQADAFSALTKAFEKAPARLQTTIALGMASSPQGGDKLLDAVAQGKASPRLLQDRAVANRLRQSKVVNLDDRLVKLTRGLPAADQRMLDVLNKKRDGFKATKANRENGQKVFTKHCASCHQIANQGAKIAPQLDGIGIRGLERLLEDVLDPNRNVDQAFRATTLVLKNGQQVTGLFLREDGKVFVMADHMGKEIRIDAKEVDERIVGQLSPMPSNFNETIAADEFNDLLAYLLAQRVKE